MSVYAHNQEQPFKIICSYKGTKKLRKNFQDFEIKSQKSKKVYLEVIQAINFYITIFY